MGVMDLAIFLGKHHIAATVVWSKRVQISALVDTLARDMRILARLLLLTIMLAFVSASGGWHLVRSLCSALTQGVRNNLRRPVRILYLSAFICSNTL